MNIEKSTHPTKESCELCHSSFLCGSLAGILKIIETTIKENNDTYFQERLREFRERIKHYGYQYPAGGEDGCWLADKPSIIKDLLGEASTMYKEMISQNSTKKEEK